MNKRDFFLLFYIKMSLGYSSPCYFPKPWHGEYFHLGFADPLEVVNSTISGKGRCVENIGGGSHFVMEDKEYGETCWRCMTIYRKHHNVLQYKESYCETYFQTFDSLCENIAGDAPMYSMFRRSAEPVRCPFKGPFSFSYTKGGSGINTCSDPKSYLDSCTENTRLQLNFQACIDVPGSESVSEELTCIAVWKEGSKKYMVAEMNREHVYNDESKYRCFVYQKSGKGENKTVKMAQSLSATCNGLWSPSEGYRTFNLDKVPDPHPHCMLPMWIRVSHQWRSLDSEIQMHVNKGEKSFNLHNLQDSLHPEDSHVTCHDIVSSKTVKGLEQIKLVTYWKSECDSGFVCSVFIRQSPNVVKVHFGHKSRSPTEACSDLYFSNSVGIKSLLLVARTTSDNPSVCPLSGRYLISQHSLAPLPISSDCPPSKSSTTPLIHLISGCGSSSLTVEQQCEGSNKTLSEYKCIAQWNSYEVNSRIRLTHTVISSPYTSRLLCLTYTENVGSLSSHNCHIPKYQEHHHNTFNISQSGPCVQALTSVSSASQTLPHTYFLLIVPLMFYVSVPSVYPLK